MKVFDLLTDEDDDLLIRGGDFEIGESTEQHQRHIIQASKGHYRRTPYVGAGIDETLSDDAPGAVVLAEIQEQLELDGQNITTLQLDTNGNLKLVGYYRGTDE
jgi:hypothetical protein